MTTDDGATGFATIFHPFVDEEPTLTDKVGSGEPPPGSSGSPSVVAAIPALVASPGPRYEVKGVLGRGGMGEVRLCHDTRMGRQVAIKVARGEAMKGPAARARFLREACIQGQLEHPAIVPVHDLDVLDDGSAYFAMKRVRGQTLSSVLAGARPPLRKLLAAFNSVCLAVDFAHTRGVVHRDIKPQNIMLGDFGEVYLLDWGVAKVTGAPDEDIAGPQTPPPGGGVHTEVGSALGTPGYMAPEQIDVSVAPISPRTDVYALGGVLFEILAGSPVIATRDVLECTLATLQGVDGHPARRAPGAGIPAELDAICARALARAPADRFASARELQEAVDGWLAGVEDLDRRRTMSSAHARAAADAMAQARAPDETTVRTHALQELGRALALDADNAEARHMLVRLLTTPPSGVPEAVRARLIEEDRATVRAGARNTALVILGILPFIPLALWIGVKDWLPASVGIALILFVAVSSLAQSRMTKPNLAVQFLNLVAIYLSYLAFSRIFGPLIMLPAALVGLAAASQAHTNAPFRLASTLLACGTICVAMALEFAGILDPSYVAVDGGLLVREHMLTLDVRAIGFLVVASLGAILAPAFFVQRIRRALSDADTKLRVQAWQLEQLVADATPDAARSRLTNGGDP